MTSRKDSSTTLVFVIQSADATLPEERRVWADWSGEPAFESQILAVSAANRLIKELPEGLFRVVRREITDTVWYGPEEER